MGGFESGVNYANEHFGTDVEVVELPSYAGVDVNGNDVGGNYVGSLMIKPRRRPLPTH